MKKRGFVTILTALAAGAAVYGLFFGSGGPGKDKGELQVEALPVYRTEIHDSVEALGTALANESIDITPTVTETISDIRFEDGQHVKKGDIIALLEQNEELAQLQAAKARQVENQRELKRLEDLLKNKAAARRDYDERLTQIEIAKREVEEMQARIEDRTLRAPFDGVLGIRRLSRGALVQPGQLITTLDDTSQIKLDFAVPSVHLASLTAGVAIEAYNETAGSKPFHGTVASVNTRIDPVTRSILVRALLPNGDGKLKPGQLLRVVLLRNAHEGLVVAEESLIQRGRDYFVFTVTEDGTVQQRQVRLGTRRPGIAEITDGLKEGEIVITRGVSAVREGQKATIARLWDKVRLPEAGNASLLQTGEKQPDTGAEPAHVAQ